MSYYNVGPSEENYQFLVFDPPLELMDRGKAAEAEGRSMSVGWKPIKTSLVIRNNGKNLLPADLYLHVGSLCLSHRAYFSLRDLLDKQGLVLPLLWSESEPVYVFENRILDCLDVKKSSFRDIPGLTPLILMRPILRDDVPANMDIFRPPFHPWIFVSQRFVDLANACGLVGVSYEQVPTASTE